MPSAKKSDSVSSKTPQFYVPFLPPPDVGDFVGDHVGFVSVSELTERQLLILNLIGESPTVTAKEMSETLSVSKRTVERELSFLKESGILGHKGKRNEGVWVIHDLPSPESVDSDAL